MNRSTRMLLMSHSDRDKRDRDRERHRRMGIEYEDWTPRDRYDDMPEGRYEPFEDRFRDRRGRWHYDNGRYAPRDSWDGYEPPMGEYMPPEDRRRYRRYSDGRFAPRGYFDENEHWPRDTVSPMRPIGFMREADPQGQSDATMPRYNEMDRMSGNRANGQGRIDSKYMPRFDRRMAMKWAEGMENSDGTKGPHWPMEKVKQVMEQYNVQCDPDEFFAVINSLYADYGNVFKTHGASKIEFYVDMAKAWIEDPDAVDDKAAAYYTYVVKH